MPKRDEDNDFFMDDSMSMQAESPNVLYYIYIYIMGQRVAYGRGPSHGRSAKHETHVLKDPSPQMNCDVVLITGSSTAFSFTGAPASRGLRPWTLPRPMLNVCYTRKELCSAIGEQTTLRHATSSSIESSTRVCHRPTSSTI